MGVHPVDDEGDHAPPVLESRAEDGEAGDPGVAQPPQGVGGDLPLVRLHRLHAQALQILDRRPQPDDAADVLRPRLELPRHLVPRGVVEPDVADHLAPAQERVHLLEQRAPRPQPAGAHRREHLVAGESVEVGAELPDVHPPVRGALRPVHDHEGPARVGGPGDLGDRVDRAERVAHVHEGHDLRPRGDQAIEAGQNQPPLVVEGDVPQAGAALLREQLPGHEVAVVLHLGEEDLVAPSDVAPAPGVRHEVEGLGDVAGEDDLGRLRRPQESGDLGARRLVLRGGALGDRVDAPVDVRVVLLVVPDHRLDHLARLLGGGRAVQIHQRLPIDALPEDRKIVADRCRDSHRLLPRSRLRPPRRPSAGGAPPPSSAARERPAPRRRRPAPGRSPPSAPPAAPAPGRS